jgi:hypothetical protein
VQVPRTIIRVLLTGTNHRKGGDAGADSQRPALSGVDDSEKGNAAT